MGIRNGFKWQSKPPPGAGIDRSRPLAAGLAVSLLFDEGGGEPFDAAGVRTFPASHPAVWSVTEKGLARYATGGTSAVEIPASALPGFIGFNGTKANPFTIRVVFRPRTWPGADVTLFDSPDRAPSAFFNTSGNAAFSLNTSQSLGLAAGSWWDLTLSRPAADASATTAGLVYVNGAPRGTFGFDSYATSTGPLCFGRNPSGGTGPADADYALIQIWQGVSLSAGDVAALYADPYSVYLAPTTRRFFSLPAAGTSGAGSADGLATASGVGAALASGAGSASGAGTASGSGASLAAGAGSAAGSAAASGVGASSSSASGSADGLATASGVGAALASGAGSSSGVATATGVGSSVSSGSGVGTADGIATASGAGAALAAGAGSATGAASASGVGSSVASGAGTGTAFGASTALAVGASLAAGAGTASGAATASGVPPGGPATSVLIRQAVAAALAADATLAGLFGARIRPLAPREKEAPPSLTYELAANARERTLDGPLGKSRARFLFVARSKSLADGQAAAEAIRNLLDGFRSASDGLLGGVASVDWCHQEGEADTRAAAADGSDAGTFETRSEYLVRYKEPKPVR